jgi:hypothetical protein
MSHSKRRHVPLLDAGRHVVLLPSPGGTEKPAFGREKAVLLPGKNPVFSG